MVVIERLKVLLALKWVQYPERANSRRDATGTRSGLWPIILTFVEFGFGSHPLQLACGQLTKDLEPDGQTDSDRERAKLLVKMIKMGVPRIRAD
ncbi:hypothetical protein [Roseobacter sp.]|uniref:hypothetical protein n=1 Tax=Roseobacter sp. TaxID=1907202 RepID=UPI0032980A79